MRLHFMGGADTVTGSQHIVEANGHLVLRDCGMFQGRRKEAREINEVLPFDASHLHSVILSHAHLDHCGNLPTLSARGYEGSIRATSATVALTAIMLRDSARIQEQDAAYLNQKTDRGDAPPVVPLYTMADAERALKLLREHEYDALEEVAPGIDHTFYDAGHILGSALSLFTVREDGKTYRIGFAVDLGRKNLPLIRDPVPLPEGLDVLVIESTYGDRMHDAAADAASQLEAVVARTLARGGRVLIPSFALERAQEIIFHLTTLVVKRKIPRVPVYVDSPMAGAITQVFDENVDFLDDEFRAHARKSGCLMCPSWVKFTASVEESKAVTSSSEPCIVIAASGMCEHGRILHHLKQGIGNPQNTVAIVGFQAVYTLGRRLVDGVKEVRIYGDLFNVKAEIAVLHAFSAHADRAELIEYVRRVRPASTYLVHGEQNQREALAEALRAENLSTVFLPKRGDVAEV